MFKKQNLLFLVITGAVVVGFFIGSIKPAHAYDIQQVPVQPVNDFVLGPGKQEVDLDPGQSTVNYLTVTDRIPGTTTFKMDTEDIAGSQDPSVPVVILDGEKGPYSAKDFITTDPSTSFSLTLGDQITIPVTISIPKDAPPGGYYSAVLISNEPVGTTTIASASAQGSLHVISRLGTLFFIRVNGPVTESGQVQDFSIDGLHKLFYSQNPSNFDIVFNNTGTVYLVPYGTITIRNMFGEQVAQLPVDADYVFPQSLRLRQIPWQSGLLFGRYTATLNLNRGYGNISDTKTISFWVVPWKVIIITFIILFALVFSVMFFLRTFEIRKK